MKKKWIAVLLAVCLCFLFSGCSFTAFNTKNLMAPPKANEDQQAIHALLQGGRPGVTFIYPKSGEYRSAVIMQDFTGDGQEDAIGFYSLEDAGGVEVQFLVKSDGQWETAATFKSAAIQVDRVCFSDLTGSGVDSVLIGWGSAAGVTGRTASVNAYVYDSVSGGVTEYSLGIYGEMAVTDLDGDGVGEVFTVDKFVPAEVEGDEPTPAIAQVYGWKNGAMAKLYSADADNSISSYSSAVFGRLTVSLSGVVLDGLKADGSLTTQVFYLEDGRLINAPSGVNTEEYSNPYSRPPAASFLSRDINGDGFLEIPRATLLPGLSEDVTPDSTSYQVEWFSFQRNNSEQLAVRALMNSAESYWFRLPAGLRGKITASNDTARRTVTYMEVTDVQEDGQRLLGSPLFAIRAFTRSAWESRGQTGGYEFLISQNDVVYGIQVLTSDETSLRYINRIKEDFKLLSES